MTLQSQLIDFLAHEKEWRSKGTLTADIIWKHKMGRSYGKRFLPETVGRALRTLEEKSIIAVRAEGISVKYRWIPHEWRSKYIPYSQRPKAMGEVLWRS